MLALLYDIHGNLEALEAVLEDARAQGASGFLLGGDYTLFGPRPLEVLERLRELDAHWVRGNGERWTADPAQAPDTELVQNAVTECRVELGGPLVAEMAGLATSHVRDDTLFCHGSPLSDVESFLPDPDPDDERKLAGTTAQTVVFGHTHLQFERTSDRTRLINPGSVGMPFDGDARAAYALFGQRGEVTFRRVGYDNLATAEAVRRRFGSWAETVARRLEEARFDA